VKKETTDASGITFATKINHEDFVEVAVHKVKGLGKVSAVLKGCESR
jgi:hypothetical protein